MRNKLINLKILDWLMVGLFISTLFIPGCTAPLSDAAKLTILQEGNSLPKTRFSSKQSNELTDNRIGFVASNLTPEHTPQLNELTSLGIKRMNWTVNENEAPMRGGVIAIDWSNSEFFDLQNPGIAGTFLDGLNKNGIISTYMLTFWDKANHSGGWQIPYQGYTRFKTEEEIRCYLDYVRFVVRYFKGRIQYYELWNEPEQGTPLQQIEVADYINLVKRTVPVILREDPEAKIVVGGVALQYERSRDYLLDILESDIMPLVDVICWHPLYSTSPEHDSQYYYEYPSIVQEIKDVAFAHGFSGEYKAAEVCYWSPDSTEKMPRSQYLNSNVVAAKYYARGLVMNLGLDLTTGTAGLSSLRVESFTTVQNLSTLMAGAKPFGISVEIHSTATNIKIYGFSLPGGSQLIALWTDGVAVDDDPGIKATLTIKDVSAQKVIGIDVLNSFEQTLIVSREGSNLITRDLLIKDYPIFLRLIP